MSDSTNLCSGVAGVDLYDHIGSMMHTTVPAALISLVLYWIMGLKYTASSATDENVQLMLTTLDSNFKISLLALVPAILMIVIAVAKIPAVLGLTSCSVFSIFWAMLMQGCSFSEVMAKPDGAFYMFVKAPNGDAAAFSERAMTEQNLLVVPGTGFGCPGYFRLSYCVSGDMIRRSLPAFRAMIDSYK